MKPIRAQNPTNHRSLVSPTTGAASYFPQQQQQGYAYSALPTTAAGTMSLPAAAAAYAAAAGPTAVNQTATVRLDRHVDVVRTEMSTAKLKHQFGDMTAIG